MKKRKVIVLGLIILVVAIAGVVYNYIFNSAHRNIANEEATITLSAEELFSQFQNDEVLATTNYLDKVLEIKGTITLIETGEVVLNNQIQVGFNTEFTPELVPEASITIKGRCVGYDELLEMVKVDQAIIINK